jgi:hypothetical protein
MARGRKRAASRDHVSLEETVVTSDTGAVSTEFKWRCKYCAGADDGGIRKTVTFPASRFDVHITSQCTKAPEDVKNLIVRRSLSNALRGGIPKSGRSYTALLLNTQEQEPGAGGAADADATVGPGGGPAGTAAGAAGEPASLEAGAPPGGPPGDVGAAGALAGPQGASPPAKRRKTRRVGLAAGKPDGEASGVHGAARPGPRAGAKNGGLAVTGEARSASITESIARFFCATGLPLSLATTSLFRGMVAELNPPYGLAMEGSAEVWYEKWLPRLHARIAEEAERGMAGPGAVRTVGLDHFTAGDSLFVNLFESTLDSTVFYKCEDLGKTVASDDPSIVRMLEEHLSRNGDERVEEEFAGVVGNLGGLRRDLMLGLQKKYSRSFFIGCARRSLEKLIADLVAVPQVAWTIGEALAALRFGHAVAEHGRHRLDWRTRVWGAEDRLQPVEVADMLGELLEKRESLRRMMAGLAPWPPTREGVGDDAVGLACLQKFLKDPAAAHAVTRCLALLHPASRALRQVEKDGCGLSWVYPLFTAVEDDTVRWSRADGGGITPETTGQAVAAVREAWSGGLFDAVHTFAWLMDPHTTPLPEELPDGSRGAVRLVLERMCADKQNMADEVARGLNELEGVLLREGEWGKVIAECQESLAAAGAPAAAAGSFLTDGVLERMSVATDGSRKWRAYGSRQYAALRACAVRALSLSGVSGWVAGVRTGGMAAAAGGGDLAARLGDETVRRLMYVYVNARLAVRGAAGGALERSNRFEDFVADALR